jgi:hypothetical protein
MQRIANWLALTTLLAGVTDHVLSFEEIVGLLDFAETRSN